MGFKILKLVLSCIKLMSNKFPYYKEIWRYEIYIKLRTSLLNVKKFQECVHANPCEPPEFHQCFYH